MWALEPKYTRKRSQFKNRQLVSQMLISEDFHGLRFVFIAGWIVGHFGGEFPAMAYRYWELKYVSLIQIVSILICPVSPFRYSVSQILHSVTFCCG